MKRFISIIMACIMFCCFASVSAFAQEVEPSQAPSQEVTEQVSTDASIRSLGKVLATNGGTIYNGSGTIAVTLPSGNFSADFMAQIGYTTQNSVVTCTVRTPSGDSLYLGSMSGTGSSTDTYNVFFAEAGTYYFYFMSANTNAFDVACYIYD